MKPLTVAEGKETKYISALNTRRNPDIIMPGAVFLKGNRYFKRIIDDNE